MKWLLAFLGVMTLAVLGAWHYGAWPFHQGHIYKTVVVQKGDVRSVVTANGTSGAVVTVQVGSQVSGNIKSLYADFNTIVKKGQLLAQIDAAPFEAKLAQARAALDAAKSQADSAKASVGKAEADVRSAQAQLNNEEAAVTSAISAESDSRIKYMSRRDEGPEIVSPEDQEAAQSTYEIAEANREAAQAQETAAEDSVSAVKDLVDAARAQADSAQGQVHEAEAAVQQAQLDLDHTRIESPIEGVVISRDIDVGQTVAASFQTPTLFEIAQDLDQMQVDVNIDESDVGELRPGQAAEFTVDALPGKTFSATLRQVRKAPVNVQNVITYDAILRVTSPDDRLFPGMTANVKILAGDHPESLKVENSALRYRPVGSQPNKEPTLYVLDANGKAQARLVKTGYKDGNFTEITSGIQAGDAVIVSETTS